MKILALISFLINLWEVAESKNCSLQWTSTSNLPTWFPLIWNKSEIIYPSKDAQGIWNIAINGSSAMQVGCTTDPTSNLLKKFQVPSLNLTCNGDGNFTYQQKSTSFLDLGCANLIKEKVNISGLCYSNYTNANILFQSNSNQFPLIQICHNSAQAETIMAHHIVHGAALNPFESSNARPSFKEAQFYPTIAPAKAYTQAEQLTTMSGLVGSDDLAKIYIDPLKSYYFARGHLAPDGDFVHIYEQNASYYYINVVPQWQSINNGNWKALEKAVRDYATLGGTNLKVWTGGKGVLKLVDVNGNPVEIYLAKDAANKKLLPAPELSWKVIQDPAKNAAIAIFMVNNPHLQSVPSELILCPDICYQVPWVTWSTTTISKGYTYCCDVNEIQAILPLVPEFKNATLLT